MISQCIWKGQPFYYYFSERQYIFLRMASWKMVDEIEGLVATTKRHRTHFLHPFLTLFWHSLFFFLWHSFFHNYLDKAGCLGWMGGRKSRNLSCKAWIYQLFKAFGMNLKAFVVHSTECKDLRLFFMFISGCFQMLFWSFRRMFDKLKFKIRNAFCGVFFFSSCGWGTLKWINDTVCIFPFVLHIGYR